LDGDPHHRGGEGCLSLASKLVRTALSEARSDGLAVLPFCPFVRGYIAGHSEYLDLVPEDTRARFELTAHA
jgi:predicted GNAT family acetyltransferase